MFKILVLDDSPEVRYGIYDYFKIDYEVYIAKKEKEVCSILNKTRIDLIIFDYTIISTDIKEFINYIKEINNHIQIFLISKQFDNIVFHYNIDEYMTKPLNLLELDFRIKKLFNQTSKNSNLFYLNIDVSNYSLIYYDKTIIFTKKEFQLLELLFNRPSQIFTKEFLIDTIWEDNFDICDNTLRTHINRVRKKTDIVKKFKIITIKGIGTKEFLTPST